MVLTRSQHCPTLNLRSLSKMVLCNVLRGRGAIRSQAEIKTAYIAKSCVRRFQICVDDAELDMVSAYSPVDS